MFDHAIRLRAGTDPAALTTSLDGLAVQAGNVASGRTSSEQQQAFLLWSESVEAIVARATFDRQLQELLLSDRYWRIRAIDERTVRPIPLIAAEVDRQVGVLTEVVTQLRKRIDAAYGIGAASVLDTNVLLHHQLPNKIGWPELLKVDPVRLIVPLAVVAEIDEKKYAGSPDVRTRARKLLPQLEALLGHGATEIRSGVTLEVPPSFERRLGHDADTWVLDSCHELATFGAGKVRLITADTGMTIRARSEGIDVFRMPRGYEAGPSA